MPTIRFVNERKKSKFLSAPICVTKRSEPGFKSIPAWIRFFIARFGLLWHVPHSGPQRNGELEPDGFARGTRLKVSMDYIGHEDRCGSPAKRRSTATSTWSLSRRSIGLARTSLVRPVHESFSSH